MEEIFEKIGQMNKEAQDRNGRKPLRELHKFKKTVGAQHNPYKPKRCRSVFREIPSSLAAWTWLPLVSSMARLASSTSSQ